MGQSQQVGPLDEPSHTDAHTGVSVGGKLARTLRYAAPIGRQTKSEKVEKQYRKFDERK